MKQLYIGVDDVIMALLRIRKQYYIDLSAIDGFESYIKAKFAKQFPKEYSNVVVDLNEDAICRLTQYNKSLELVGQRLYYIEDINTLPSIEEKDLNENIILSIIQISEPTKR